MKKIFISSLLITLSISFTFTTLTSAKSYPDVNSNSTFYKYITGLSDDNVIQGFSDGTFRPDECVKRNQLAKFIVKGLGFENDKYEAKFPDVTDFSDPLNKDIMTLNELGIVNGFSDGSFRPNNCVTRGEATTFVMKSLIKKGYSQGNSSVITFNDISNSDHKTYITTLSGFTAEDENVIKGSGSKFNPDLLLTRSQMAKIIYLTRKYIQNNGGTLPTLTPTTTLTPTPVHTGGIVQPTGDGIWISNEEIAALKAEGDAWDNMKKDADSTFEDEGLYNQEAEKPQLVLAAALVAAKKGTNEMCGSEKCIDKAKNGILGIMDDTPTSGGGDGRALGLGRNLAAYVIAADVINLDTLDPSKNEQFKTFIKAQRDKTGLDGACDSLVYCHQKRPNNWGAMAGASRIAVDLYTKDTNDLADAIKVFKGFIGDYDSYHDFNFSDDTPTWACDPNKLIPINPDCTVGGMNVSGAQIDDVQRSGPFNTNPVTNYAWGGLSATVAQAEMLHRADYDSYEWSNKAMLRGMNFLANEMESSASSATNWMPWVIQKRYGKGSFNYTPIETGGGRLLDWTDWTHGN
jgi:hypothetical protein